MTINTPATPERPQSATLGVWLFYASSAVSLLRAPFELNASPPPGQSSPFGLVSAFVGLLFLALVIDKTARGRNWARMLFATLFLAGLPVMYLVAAQLEAQLSGRPVATALTVLNCIAQAAAIFLLFTPSSNSWFRDAKAYRLGNKKVPARNRGKQQVARAQAGSPRRGPTESADPLVAIQKLGELMEAGLITEQEYENKKAKLLDRV
jgi:hypothetical protein